MKILQLVPHLGPTSTPYYHYTVPLLDVHRVTLCSLCKPETPVDCRVDMWHGDGRCQTLLGQLVALARQQTFDVVHVHDLQLAWLWIVAAMVTRPTLLRRSILHMHRDFTAIRFWHHWMLLPVFLIYSRIVCCSHAARFSFPVVYRLAAGKRMVTIRSGADVRRADQVWTRPKAGYIDRSHDLQLVCVGRLERGKNFEVVVRAVALSAANDVQLTIIGDGPMREALGRLARELDVSHRVHLVGQLSPDLTMQTLWAADGFISMSRLEGLPVAVLEAMCCHCPVLLSDIPAHREIRGRRCDLIPLFEPHDVKGLADAIDDWASMPMDVMRAWGADCRQHVEFDFSLDASLDQFEVLLEDFDPVLTPEWDAYCRSLQAGRSRRAA